jgi:hypothetical protein
VVIAAVGLLACLELSIHTGRRIERTKWKRKALFEVRTGKLELQEGVRFEVGTDRYTTQAVLIDPFNKFTFVVTKDRKVFVFDWSKEL